MLNPALRHVVFVHRFVEAVTWQPLRKRLAPRPLARASAKDSPALPTPSRAA